MITTVIGRTFLDIYNEKNGLNISPQEFFEKEYFELFFNHPKYMQWVINSPFVQGGKPENLSEQDRRRNLETLFEKVETQAADASFALGYPASELKEYASTSGLVSDLEIPTDKDDVYLSWIGSSLGIGVAGGYNILFDDPEITYRTFEGWKYYREYLNDPTLERLRGNQVNTWNGQWLTYLLNKEVFRDDFEFSDLEDQNFFNISNALIEVNTIPWSRLFFSLSQFYPDKEIVGNVYGFGQTNKTVGFIPFQLKSGTRLIEVYQKLFANEIIDKRKFESLFGIHIKRACELGSVGLQALRPEDLTKYMGDSKNIQFTKEEHQINYFAYKTWLIAMLTKNKEEISDYTLDLAAVILKYRNGGKGMERKTLVEKELFASKSKKPFVESLSGMIAGLEGEDLEKIRSFKDELHLMTNEEFGYFSTLLKFDYAYLEKKS